MKTGISAMIGGKLRWAMLVCALCPMAARAQATLFNTGFEDLVLADGATGGAPFWGPLSGAGTINPTSAMYAGGVAPEGSNVGFLNGNPSLMNQAFGPLTFGTYTIQIDIGQRLDMPLANLGISMRSGTTILSVASNSGGTPNPGQFITRTLVWNILPTNVNGGFVGGNGNILLLATGGGQVNIDNVRITFSPIPEPATAFGSAAALLAMVAWRRRRRSRLARR